MLQIVGLFLIGMVVLAIAGRLRKPGAKRPRAQRKCPACGRYRIGSGPCPCGRGGKA